MTPKYQKWKNPVVSYNKDGTRFLYHAKKLRKIDWDVVHGARITLMNYMIEPKVIDNHILWCDLQSIRHSVANRLDVVSRPLG